MTDQVLALENFGKKAGIITGEDVADSEKGQLPTVLVPGGAVSNTRSAETLYGHVAPTKQLFLRDGNVSQIVKRRDIEVLEMVKPAAAISLFEEFVQFVTPRKGKVEDGKPTLRPTTISKPLAEMYLSANAKDILPEISSILACPIIKQIGDELHVSESGYDAKTKTLILADVKVPLVTLEQAVKILKGLLDEFDFQTPGDRSRAIAAFITPALKMGKLLRGSIPADVAEADKSQSGKTYRQKMIAAIYKEALNMVTVKKGGVGSLDESFGTALFEGRPFIQFDNIRGKFDLQALEAFLTAENSFPVRAAYSKQVTIDPSNFMILINSNGYQTTPDLANRSSIVRIKKREGYHFKPWEGVSGERGDMLDFVKKFQPLLLSCVFAVIREWFEKGRPRTPETRHDFREWCQTLDWIVQNIFGEVALMDGHQEAQARVTNPGFTFLRQVAIKVDERMKLGDWLRASDFFEICQENQINIPGLSPDKQSDDSKASMAIGRCLAALFAKNKTIEIEGYQVERSIEVALSHAGNEQEVKSYLFTSVAKS